MLRISEYCQNIWRNLFTVLIMTLIALLLQTSASLILRETEMYKPFSALKHKWGFICSSENIDISFLADYEIEEYCTYRGIIANSDDYYISSCVYPDWVLENWSPRLAAGTWIDTASINTIVVGGKTGNISVGDTLSLSMLKNDGELETIDFTVSGILAENTKLLNGADSYSADDKGYKQCYKISDADIMVVMSESTAVENGIMLNKADQHIYVSDSNISEDDYREAYNKLMKKTSGAAKEWSVFIDESENIIAVQMLTYIPIVLFGMLLIVIGICVSAYINLKMSMDHMGVFYLIGASPADRFRLNISTNEINTVLSVLLLIFVNICISKMGFRERIIIDYSAEVFLIVIAYYIINILLAMLFYWITWNRLSPKEALIKKRIL